MLSSIRKQRAVLEVERRKNRESTFTEPIHCSATDDPVEFDHLKQFLTHFYRTIYHRQAEIRQLLEDEPSVAQHYHTLVNTSKAAAPKQQQQKVTMEEFWQRYFYRCDVERLLQQWDRRDASARQARAEAIAGSITSMSKLAKSWSEKAAGISMISSLSSHGPTNNNNSNGNNNNNSPNSSKSSAPASPTSKKDEEVSTIIATASSTGTKAALEANNGGASNITSIVNDNQRITTKAPEEESVVFDDEPSQPNTTAVTAATGTAAITSATMTTTTTTANNSRVLALLQDDDDDETSPPQESPDQATATTSTLQPVMMKDETENYDKDEEQKRINTIRSTVNVSNTNNDAAASEPMLTKITSTKLTTLMTTATTLTTDIPLVSPSPPPPPASSPTLFREWSRGTSPPSQQEVESQGPTLPSLNSTTAPSTTTTEMPLSGESFPGRHLQLQDKATTQLKALETTLINKSILRDPSAVTDDDNDDKANAPLPQEQLPPFIKGARPLEEVMRDFNHTTATADTDMTSTTTTRSTIQVEPPPVLTVEENDKTTANTTTNESDNAITSTSTITSNTDVDVEATEETKEAETVTLATNNGIDETAPAKEEDVVPPLQPLVNVSELQDATSDLLNITTELTQLILEDTADKTKAQSNAVTVDETIESNAHMKHENEMNPQSEEPQKEGATQECSNTVISKEDASQPIIPEEVMENISNEGTKEKSNSDGKSSIAPNKAEFTAVSTKDETNRDMTSEAGSVMPSGPPTSRPARETKHAKDDKEASDKGRNASVQQSSSRFGIGPIKPKRRWLLSILGMGLLVCLAVMRKVTTTPDRIQFIDGLCAPVQPGTKFPLEASHEDDGGDKAHEFDAPWWAPLAYKQMAFGLVCESTTNKLLHRDRIRLTWTTIGHVVPWHRKIGGKNQKQERMHRLVISSLVQKEGGPVVEVLYDAWLTSATVKASEIETVDKRGVQRVVTNLWTDLEGHKGRH
jgi:hypothetical protein